MNGAVARAPVTVRIAPVPCAPAWAVYPRPPVNVVAYSVASGSQVTMVLDNRDQAVPHDIGIDLPGVAKSTTCSGPCTATLSFTAPVAGRYNLFCSLHIDMKGSLTVTP